MYRERSSQDHENYVDRFLHAEDNRLKQITQIKYVKEELDYEMQKFATFYRIKKVKDQAKNLREAAEGKKESD
jgi:predicted nucleic acid-binding protein